MHLQPTEEQEALRDAVARFLEKASSPEAVREAEPLGWDPKVWAGLTEMGVPTLGVPEAQGGSGASRNSCMIAQRLADEIRTSLAPAARCACESLPGWSRSKPTP